jgi:integrase/recombinase XerC
MAGDETLPPLPQLCADFLRDLETIRRASPHTITNYHRDLESFLAFCRDRNLDSALAVDNADVRMWIAKLRHHLSGRSVQRALSALRTLYKHVQRTHHVSHNPVVGISAPKTPRHLPKALDIDQMQQLLDNNADDFLNARDQAMMEVLYSSGLRLAELISLNVDTIDFANGELTVIGKGNKTRIVPIGTVALQAIKQWLNFRATISTTENALFISARGNRISPRSVQDRISKQSLLRGVPQCIHTCCGIHSRAICSNRAAICARCRNYSATKIWRPRKFIRIWISSISRRFTMPRIRVPHANAGNRKRPQQIAPNHERSHHSSAYVRS